MDVFWSTLLLLLHFHTTGGVQCFSRFVPSTLTCEGVIGAVDQDSCCLNSKYGYQTEDGLCHSCSYASWTSWTEWSQCTSACGEGVRLRRRSSYGVGHLLWDKDERLQAQACNGTCCDEEGWSPWSDWSVCSVTCGVGGVKHRLRHCSDRPECAVSCTGKALETQDCHVLTCPVHGGWSEWSDWSKCSGSCIHHHDNVPTRVRRRFCSSPSPSADPPGHPCQGDDAYPQRCTELPNCAVDGGWGLWTDPGPCSVTCGEGLQLSHRSCDQPPPRYGGRQCEGPSTKTSVCNSPCPVPSFWTGWSQWSECSGTCLPDGGRSPQRTRHRLCMRPGGTGECEGPTHESGPCPGLDYCKVHGSWGPWSAYSACPVTCGLGLQTSTRSCSRPAPKHGGDRCPGDDKMYKICNAELHCPVDGEWSDWSAWSACVDIYDPDPIKCKNIWGTQSQERICLHTNHNGAACPGDLLSQYRNCYDVTRCPVEGQWDGWEPWSLCTPACGGGSKRKRRRRCKPTYKGYDLTVGLRDDPVAFFGTPIVLCELSSQPSKEEQNCYNTPPC